MKQLSRLRFAVMVTLITGVQVYAQTGVIDSGTGLWVGTGVGVGVSPGVDGGLAGNIHLTYNRGRSVWSARTASAGDIIGDSFFDIGILYGLSLARGPMFLSAGVGLSYVDGQRSEGLFGHREPVDPTVGMPLEVQLFYRPLRFLGVGIYGFGNLNWEENFAGATLGLQLGRFR